jgi:hypothetical protein
MPADFSQYVDLTVYDKEPGDMYLEAIEMARLTLPEFNLRTGTVEDAIFQAMSWIGWVNATAVNRIPDRLMAGILSMMGVTVRLSSPAQMYVSITADSYEGATVPPGAVFGYTSVFEDEVIEYVFFTVESAEILPIEDAEPGDAFPSAIVLAECLTPGVIPSIPDGTTLSILTPSTSIISARSHVKVGATPEEDYPFINGVNDENSSAFLSRAVSYLSSLSSTLVKSNQVDAYVSNTYSGLVGRVKTYDLTDGDPNTGNISTNISSQITESERAGGDTVTLTLVTENNQFEVGDNIVVFGVSDSSHNGSFEVVSVGPGEISYLSTGDNGTATGGTVSKGLESIGNISVFVYGNGSFLNEAQLLDIKNSVTDKVVPGLLVNVRNFALLPLQVNADVVLDSNYDQQPLKQTIENSIVEYLSPSGFPTSEESIKANQVIALISSIPGVRYVSYLSINPSSFSLPAPNEGWLPQVGGDLQPRTKGSVPRVTPDEVIINYVVA